MMIKVKNLTKKFGDFTAVEDVSFEIAAGDIVGFLGPNGAGKTTTMRMLAGFTFPDEGDIKMMGKNFNTDEFDIKSKVGYMPENNPLYRDMLVSEFLDLTVKLNNLTNKKRKERIDYVVNAVDIADKYYKPINELSKGYRQRVGLAAALINEPKILILDEPTEGLDPNQRAEIRKLITDVGEDRTVLISTHVMQEVEAMCNRIIIINEGKVVADGDKESILAMKDANLKINMELAGKDMKKELEKLDFVKTLEAGGSKKNTTQFRLHIKDGKSQHDVYKDLSELIAKNKWVIYKFMPVQESLEDIFQRLTKKA